MRPALLAAGSGRAPTKGVGRGDPPPTSRHAGVTKSMSWSVLYHTYSAYARGVDALWGMWRWLDRAPKVRNEASMKLRLPDGCRNDAG
jgi:predicted dithiol-disulfide oxidoreductase (DUF899 family)